jgi:hypothetical protein
LEDTIRNRWKRAKEHDEMRSAAIGLANGIYSEFPVPPEVYTNSPQIMRQYEREYEEKVKSVTALVISDRALNCTPQGARRIYKRLISAPPTVWSEESPLINDLGFHYVLVEFIEAYKNAILVSQTLDYRLSYHVRRINMSMTNIAHMEETDRCFYLGSVLEFPEEILLERLAPNDPDEQHALIERCQTLRGIRALDELLPRYVGSLRKIRQCLAKIQSSPRTVPNSYQDLIIGDPPWGLDPFQ